MKRRRRFYFGHFIFYFLDYSKCYSLTNQQINRYKNIYRILKALRVSRLGQFNILNLLVRLQTGTGGPTQFEVL